MFDKYQSSSIRLQGLNLDSMTFAGETLALDSLTPTLDNAYKLHDLTGILTPGAKPIYKKGGNYNSLAVMVYLLRQIGLNCRVVAQSQDTLQFLHDTFPVECQLLEELNAYPELLSSQELNDGNITPDNGLLITLIGYDNTTHYVVNNKQGLWFESLLPEDYYPWDSIEKWHESSNKREGAYWTGVSIQVTD
ncbi:hypothetical protein [Vibrio sonorensis]|uniref:hypothetical protein n=1 Tax=Vibrio sonorensis TaxID=1004316 RepID=UPI0009FFA4D9|nr:hypothetical protein [Vibrio sonorensis]